MTRTQWVKNKGRRKPFKKGDFRAHTILIVSAASHPGCHWAQEKKTVSGKERAVLEKLSEYNLPDAWLTNFDEVERTFYLRLNAGEIGMEYQGDHGLPKLYWPPQEEYDANFNAVMGALRAFELSWEPVISLSYRICPRAALTFIVRHVETYREKMLLETDEEDEEEKMQSESNSNHTASYGSDGASSEDDEMSVSDRATSSAEEEEAVRRSPAHASPRLCHLDPPPSLR